MSIVLERLDKEHLIGKLTEAERKAEQCQAEAAVFRHQLEKCLQLARDAQRNKSNDLSALISQASITSQSSNTTRWAEDWERASKGNLNWLRDILHALKRIQKLIYNLEGNASTKREMEKILKRSLIQRAPSGVSVSEIRD